LAHIISSLTLVHIVATVTLDYIIATMALDHIIAFDTIVAFFIPLFALLTSSPMMWYKEHLWNISALQRVHFSNLVTCLIIK
jgi:hypothetical protein